MLCELQGVSRREAAVRFGVAEGTLSSRLAAARKRLADRLRRRGVAPVGGIVGLLAGAGVAAARPQTVVAAAALGAGSHGAVSPAVSELVQWEMRAALQTKLTLAATGGMVLLALAVGLWRPGAAAHLAAPRAAHSPVPPPVPSRKGVIIANAFQPRPGAVVLAPSGKVVREVAVGAAAEPVDPGEQSSNLLWLGRLSPDGKHLVGFKFRSLPPNNVGSWYLSDLWVFDLDAMDGPAEAVMTGVRCPSAVWSADGTKLYGSHIDPDKVADPVDGEKPTPLVSWMYDPATKKKVPLAVPSGHAITDLSPDGRVLLTVVRVPADSQPLRSYLVPLDTFKPRLLTKTVFSGMRFSPDGRSVLGTLSDQVDGKPVLVPLVVVSVADGTERRILVSNALPWSGHACWSPDGRRIAYEWNEEVPPVPGNAGTRYFSGVTVVDTDRRNANTIFRREGRGDLVRGLDWK